MSSFSLEDVKNLVVDLGAEVVETTLQLVKKLIMRMLDMIKDIVVLFKGALFAKIRFPFIEKLVSFVTGGRTKIDTSFRLVDAIALIFAVPATIIYKIIYGEAPIRKGDVVSLPFGESISVQSGAMKRPQRIVNAISISAQLCLTGILIFDSFDKKSAKSPTRKVFKVLNTAAFTVLLTTRIINAIFDKSKDPASICTTLSLVVMLGFSVADAYAYKNPAFNRKTQELRSEVADAINVICGFLYAVPSLVLFIKENIDHKSKLKDALSQWSDILTGLPIALAGCSSLVDDGYTKIGLAVASGVSAVAGLAISIEYLTEASNQPQAAAA